MVQANLEKYKEDLEKLILNGKGLHLAMKFDCDPKLKEASLGKEADERIKKLPNFDKEYQAWYSEAKALVKQLLPDRLLDFTQYYEKPKPRKDLNSENYRIADYLQGLVATRGYPPERVVGPEAAIPHFEQQQAIINAVWGRFESSLFDIRQLIQADLFDSELATAEELLKKGFVRASGVVAGVVLEKHLSQVVANHNITTRKKAPTISDFNDLLKKGGVIDVPPWRQIQRLGDIRNLCSHNKDREPTKEEAKELISGVEKFTKTLF